MNLSISSAVEFSHVWLRAIGHASVEGGIALLLAWIICRYFARLPARVKCWLWRLAYLKLAIALLWATPVELRVLRPLQVQSATALPPPLAGFANPVRDHTPGQSTPIHFVLARPAPAPYAPHLQPTDLLALCALGLWTLTVLVLSVRLFMQWRTIQRFRHTCVAVTDPTLKHLCMALAQKLGLRNGPPIMSCKQNISPLLLGILRPVIVLPETMLNAPANELRLMLSHELAHLARRDLPWNLFSTVIETLFFFHPLIWLARRENRLAQEMAADHAALALTSTPPASYGQTLLEVASRGWAPRLPLTAGVVTSRKTLERRLIAMRHLPQWTRRNLAIAGMGLAFVAAVALPPWRLVAQNAPLRTNTPPGTNAPVREDARPAGRAETFPATVSGGNLYHIQAIADGFIREVHGTPGEVIKKGEILFVLDDRHQTVNLQLARLKLDKARAALSQKANKANDAETIDAKLDVQIAELELVSRQHDLDDTRVSAPAIGWLQYSQHQAGEFVTRGTNLAAISGPMNECVFRVPKRLLSDLSAGMKIEYRLNSGTVLKGQVVLFQTRSNSEELEVRARIQNDSELNAERGQATLFLENKTPTRATLEPAVPLNER